MKFEDGRINRKKYDELTQFQYIHTTKVRLFDRHWVVLNIQVYEKYFSSESF